MERGRRSTPREWPLFRKRLDAPADMRDGYLHDILRPCHRACPAVRMRSNLRLALLARGFVSAFLFTRVELSAVPNYDKGTAMSRVHS